MEKKAKSNNMPQLKKKDNREINNRELEFESKQEIDLSRPECAEMNAQVDPLKNPGHALVVEDKIKSELLKSSSQDCITIATCDESTKDNIQTQTHDKNVGSDFREKQSLVLNLKDRGGISTCGNNNSEVLRNLKEGISDIAKACGIQAYIEEEELQDNKSIPAKHREEEVLQDNNPSPIYTIRIDTKTSHGDHSTENSVEMRALQMDFAPDSIKMIEGCNSCSHIYKGSSMEPTSNSQTQTMNPTSRSTSTDTNTSTHRTWSSQTATQGQRNSSAQTTCINVTQECQISPDYKTTSCQTSPNSNKVRRVVIKPWAARKYQDMCMCAELGAPCTCANRKASSWEMALPRNSSWWPTVKKTLLFIAAIIPWVFLIVYSIYYYRRNY